AYPQATVDAVVVACHVVVALQTVVSRNIAPLDAAVISVGSIHAGTVNNIIADTATLKLTIRSLKPEVRELLKERIHAVVSGITLAMNAKHEIEYFFGYPSLNNDERVVNLIRKVAEGVVGNENVHVKNIPGMGGEDFSYFANKVPSAFFYIGVKPQDNPFPGHNPNYHINEEGMRTGVEMMLKLVMAVTEDM
ncbi:MAG: M20/M25/M40 family metallo-hydrolase, partial [bacterium]|nr:M20/M25/M40 family metallo-hydrolase [bacterium]